jgi:hypothetical protein
MIPGPYDDTPKLLEVMRRIAGLLAEEYGVVSDIVLVVRHGHHARTGFVSASEMDSDEARALQSEILRQAVIGAKRPEGS